MTIQKQISKAHRKLNALIQQYYVPRNPKCFLCDEQTAEMHHFVQKRQCLALRHDPKNLIPLCKSCHFTLTHKDSSLQAEIMAKKGKKWYTYIKDTRIILIKKDKAYLGELQDLINKLQSPNLYELYLLGGKDKVNP